MDREKFYNQSKKYFDVLRNQPAEYFREYINFAQHYLKKIKLKF